MNVIKTSFIYRIIQYINRIHEYSFFYRTRRKKHAHRSIKSRHSMYEYSIIFKLLCAIGRGINYLFGLINKGSKTSLIINSIGKMTEDIKYKKLRTFNQFMISLIIGYMVSNIAFNMFASYKIKYVTIFVALIIGVNIMFCLVNKYKKNSLFVGLIKKILD